MTRDSGSNRDQIRRLKEQYNEQFRLQKQRIASENELYASSKEMELRRHHEAMLALESNHESRIRQVEEHEQDYIHQLAQARAQFLMKKRNVMRAHRHQMKQFEEIEEHSSSDDDVEPIGQNVADDLYADAVVAAVLRIRDEQGMSARGRVPNQKLRLLAEELEAHLKFVHRLLAAHPE
jgi:hypothetical protein